VSDPALNVVSHSKLSVMDVVFVHGITGHHKESWTHTAKDKSTFFWPASLNSSGVPADVYSLQYTSAYTQKGTEKEFNIHELGKSVAEALAIQDIGSRPLAFVSHSMGGLVVKETLRSSVGSQNEEKKRISGNTRLVCFVATPHKGSGVASLMSAFANGISSPSIKMLSNDSGYLTSLNESYRTLAEANGTSTLAYYEKHKTSGTLLVSEQDADPGVSGCETLAIAADHIEIARPSSRDSMIYRSISRHLLKVAEKCPLPKPTEGGDVDQVDYATASNLERRDLLQKLIDAGREGEYGYANGLQNRFAQRYTKLGLLSESRLLHDQVLSEVEQRFIMHVFHAKICKDAPDDEIAAAIQVHVVDPLAEKFKAARMVGPATVLEAIYYLTQQCHLRWDKPK